MLSNCVSLAPGFGIAKLCTGVESPNPDEQGYREKVNGELAKICEDIRHIHVMLSGCDSPAQDVLT